MWALDIEVAAIEGTEINSVSQADTRLCWWSVEDSFQGITYCVFARGQVWQLQNLVRQGQVAFAMRLLPIPIDAVLVVPVPEKPPMRSLLVHCQLGMSEKCPHLFPRVPAMVSTATECEAPLTNDDRESLQLVCMLLHCPQMLCKRSSMPFVLEAMIPMHLEANALSAAFAHLGIPVVNEGFDRPLEHWQHHSDTLSSHACLSNHLCGSHVKIAEYFCRHFRRRLVANSNASDSWTRLVAINNNAQCPQGGIEPPLLPLPGASRSLSSAWRLATFATRRAMQIQQYLQAALLSPLYSSVQVLQGGAMVRITARLAKHDPVTKGHTHSIQAHVSDLLKVSLAYACLAMLRQLR
jgi:hypothetical protein